MYIYTHMYIVSLSPIVTIAGWGVHLRSGVGATTLLLLRTDTINRASLHIFCFAQHSTVQTSTAKYGVVEYGTLKTRDPK